MPVDLNIILPAFFGVLGVMSTACCGSVIPFVTVVFTAWFNNNAAHNRHEKTSRENEGLSKENNEILNKTEEVKWTMEQQQQFTASRFQDLQIELSECKKELESLKDKQPALGQKGN